MWFSFLCVYVSVYIYFLEKLCGLTLPVFVIGSDLVVADSPIGKLGLSVCYDLRFPEMYQQLRFKKDAEVSYTFLLVFLCNAMVFL